VTRRERLLAGVLALLAGGSWWLTQSSQQARVQVGGGEGFDYFLRDFRNTVYDVDGKPSRVLAAKEMRHYPRDNSTQLDAPHLILYDAEGGRWEVTARSGRLSGDGELLVLEGGVEIDGPPKGGRPGVQIEVPDLLVYPDRNIAETGSEIRIRSGSSWMVAEGMRAWFGETARIKLLSKVRGRYEIR
jgi:lipopolysaccharide export system protein LptC